MLRSSRRRSAAAATLLAAALTALTAAATALAARPGEISQPTIEGGPPFRQGITLTAGNGTWSNNPTSFSYRWQRCDANGANCANISGATNQRYKLVQADVDRAVRVLVTARNADGARTANSKPTPRIGDNARPKLVREPSISGSAVVGQQLTADPGAWTNYPDQYRYQWRQCDANGNGCSNIGGATGRVFGVRSEDVGRTLRVHVTAINPHGRTRKESNPTAVVRASAGAGPAVPISAVSLPDRLVISGVSFQPTAIRSRREIVTLRVRINDTRGRLVQGALVLAEGIPFGRVNVSGETQTDSNGIATITFQPTVRLPIVRNTAVQFFLRARKPGENVLAGVSSRRLVQIRIVPR